MDENGTRFLERIHAPDCGPVLLVAAHPDDEVVGAGAVLMHLGDAWIAHLTDGAPRDLQDARHHGFGDREAYARARREELRAALAIAGIPAERTLELGITDQEAAFHLAGLACAIAEIISERAPEIVLTHPYEGGHPDHDAAAFAAGAACRLLRAQGAAPPPLWEMTSYHDGPAGMCVSTFLPNGGGIEDRLLTAAEQDAKRRMLRCFETQEESLRVFTTELERFRPAPRYDFTRPPHEGTLFYERFDWGMTSGAFCRHAARALEALGLGATA